MVIKKQGLSGIVLLGVLFGMASMIGCTKRQKNTAIGAGVGAGSGALIGGLAGGPVGAGVGAGVGLVGGAIVGNAVTRSDR